MAFQKEQLKTINGIVNHKKETLESFYNKILVLPIEEIQFISNGLIRINKEDQIEINNFHSKFCDEIKNIAKTFIGDSNQQSAIDILKLYAFLFQNQNQIIHLEARINQLRNRQIKKITSIDQEDIGFNRINDSMLNFIDGSFNKTFYYNLRAEKKDESNEDTEEFDFLITYDPMKRVVNAKKHLKGVLGFVLLFMTFFFVSKFIPGKRPVINFKGEILNCNLKEKIIIHSKIGKKNKIDTIRFKENCVFIYPTDNKKILVQYGNCPPEEVRVHETPTPYPLPINIERNCFPN